MSHKIAHYRLDFPVRQSMCGDETSATMDPQAVKAKLNCTSGGFPSSRTALQVSPRLPSRQYRKALEIAFDIEQLIYEVNTFLNAASMINRIRTT